MNQYDNTTLNLPAGKVLAVRTIHPLPLSRGNNCRLLLTVMAYEGEDFSEEFR